MSYSHRLAGRALVTGCVATVVVAVAAAVVLAEPAQPPGAESLTRGIQALDGHQYKQAEKLFDSALARGGLTRAQTLTAYVDLGVTLVALGRTRRGARARSKKRR